MLSSGFHPVAFITHLSSGKDAIPIANLHFILLYVLIQHWIVAVFIRSMASSVRLFMFNPLFLFNFSCVILFIGVFHEEDVTVLVAICV